MTEIAQMRHSGGLSQGHSCGDIEGEFGCKMEKECGKGLDVRLKVVEDGL